MTGVQTCALPILAVQHGSSDPQASQGPWSIDILEVRPHLYRGRLVSALARDAAAGAERTSEMARSEEHTSELPSPMRISYAVFCLKNKRHRQHHHARTHAITSTIIQKTT